MPALPAVAALAASAGSVAAAGGLASLTLGSALALGASIVGAGLSIAGQVTGSKTLSKIGMGFSAAGGIGSLASNLGSAGKGAEAAANAAGAADDLSTSKGLIAAKTTGVKDVIADNAFKTFKATSGDGINSVANAVESGANLGEYANVATEPSLFERLGSNLEKYNGALNVAGGIGDAYMQTRGYQTQEDISDKNREQALMLADRSYNATAGGAVQRNVALNPNATGLLRNGLPVPNAVPR